MTTSDPLDDFTLYAPALSARDAYHANRRLARKGARQARFHAAVEARHGFPVPTLGEQIAAAQARAATAGLR